MAQFVFKLLSDNTLGLLLTETDEVTPVLTATVTATIYRADGVTEVTGQSWPMSLAHVADGLYQGNVDDVVDFVVGERVVISAIADDGPGRRGVFKGAAVVKECSD